MTKRKLDIWVWVPIYGGMLGASLGGFMLSRSPALGGTLLVGSSAVAAVGIVLIFVRSRMGP